METPIDPNGYNQKVLRYDWAEFVFLIVEDNEMNYLFLAEALKKTGVQLLWAVNGQEAVDICRSGMAISLIITDIQMPVKDGYTAACEIHALRPRIPIIAYTAYSYEGVKDRMIMAGARECLIKPFDARQLLLALRKHLIAT